MKAVKGIGMKDESWVAFKGVRVKLAGAADPEGEALQNEAAKPAPPGDQECCESGCSPCVWDTYYEALEEWQKEQAASGDNDTP